MTKRWAAYLRGFLTGAAVLAYYALAHYASAAEGASLLAVLVGLLPFAALVLVLCWRSPWRVPLLLACVLSGAGFALAWPRLQTHPSWMYFLQHVFSNLLLAFVFGRTLFGGRQPLVSYFASFIHRPVLPPLVADYTRRVTVAWTAFFLLMAGASVLLFTLAPVEAWSVFANLLALPMVVAMFLGEYLVRRCVLPPEARSSLMDSVRAYRLSLAKTEAAPGAPGATKKRP